MPQFLRTLEVRKRVDGCVLQPGNSFFFFLNQPITIDYTSLSQSSQTALKVAEFIPIVKVLRKNLN